jgi:hypothetical protein
MPEIRVPEPWLRGRLREVPVVHRAVLGALELALEDCTAGVAGLPMSC